MQIFLSKLLGKKINIITMPKYNTEGEILDVIVLGNKVLGFTAIAHPVSCDGSDPDCVTGYVFIRIHRDGYFALIQDKRGKYTVYPPLNVNIEYDIPCGVHLGRDILDKQIVDLHGRKMLRANDVLLELSATNAIVTHIDQTTAGIFRRLNLMWLYRLLKIKSEPIISWEEVKEIDTEKQNIILHKSICHFDVMHPSDVAEVLSALDDTLAASILSDMDRDKAAEILELLSESTRKTVMSHVEVRTLNDIVSHMPEDEADYILGGYKFGTVGSIMSKDYICLLGDASVKEAMVAIEKVTNPDLLNCICVAKETNEYQGVILLSELLCADDDKHICEIKPETMESILVGSPISEASEKFTKYYLNNLPVVNDCNKVVGVILLEDIMYEMHNRNKKKKKGTKTRPCI